MSAGADRVAAAIAPEACRAALVDLVRVPSPQTALMEREPLLRDFIRNAVEPRLRAMGFGTVRYDGMGNLIAEAGRGRSGRSLMLVAYAMNQPQATMTNAYAGDIADGAPHGLPGEVVLGKGASEQKGAMAAMLCALEAVMAHASPLAGRLVFVCCVSGESGSHEAIRSVVEGEGIRADIAMLGGNELMLSQGNRGRLDVFLTVHGAASHSGRPDNGCDAVTGAVTLAGILRERIDTSRGHPGLGRATLTVTHVRSFPDSTHTVQDRVEMTVDRRLLPGDEPAAALAEIAACARELETMQDPASGRPWRVEVEEGPFMYPFLLAPRSRAATLVDAAMAATAGRAPERCFSPSAFDQGYLAHMGIDTVNFGPGEPRFAHTDLDMASVERTRTAARVYARAIVDYLAG